VPELPEVEIMRRGLAPFMEGAVFTRVEARRPDLRFPLPARFARRLAGARVEGLDRRGKYLIARLSDGNSLIAHLGMSGRFIVTGAAKPNAAGARGVDPKHNHVIFELNGTKSVRIAFNDPRRFGFMDLAPTGSLDECRHFNEMGPEPLSHVFSPEALHHALSGRRGAIKSVLLDQRVVAGLGNIYACEALYRARISPRRKACSTWPARVSPTRSDCRRFAGRHRGRGIVFA